MNRMIQTIISEKICIGEISTVAQVQAAISRISDSRVSNKDIVKAICEVGRV